MPIHLINQLKSSFKLGLNKWGLLSFYNKDHGNRDGSNLQNWLCKQYAKVNLKPENKVLLITMPRVMGYVFNPVSFWLSLDNKNQLRSVLCEVNNTYGESHNYICYETDHSKICSSQWYTMNKSFHVSPYLERSGQYTFNFDVSENNINIKIKLLDDSGRLKLTTSIFGRPEKLNFFNVLKFYFIIPMMTIKVITLIYWQALKLKLKGLKFLKT